MKVPIVVGLATVLFALWASLPTRAQTPVSIELVLAVDTSLSVNNEEYALQMRGIAQAFRSEDIIDLIGLYDGVAVSLIQWGGWTSEEHTVPWQVLKSRASVLDFARQVEETRRENVGYFTAIGTAVSAAMKSIIENRYAGKLRKIDVSGDGVNNAGPLPQSTQPLAEQLGISVNGLAILTDLAILDQYYEQNVIAGPGAFVMTAASYSDFARAMHKKLKKELQVPISFRKSVPGPQPAALRQSPHPARSPAGPPY
ncbi:MAG: DUF1194 domain-containing protein [Pseudomonadota bacterium]